MSEPTISYSASSDLKQIEKERKDVKENLSKKEKEIVKVLEEIDDLHKEITKIEDEISEQNEKIIETEEKVIQYEDEFYQLLEESKQLDEQIETRTDILNNRLSAYQESGGDITFLEVIFNAKSFVDFISRVSSVTTITSAEQDIIDQQIADREEVELIQEQIVEKIDQQEQLIEDLEMKKESMDEKQASLKTSEKQLKQKENNLKKEKEKLTKEDSELKQLETTYRERIKAREKEQQNVTNRETNTKKASASKGKKETSKQKTMKVGQTLRVEATAYTPHCKGCSGVTSTGINLLGDNPPKVIAVDPKVIPLGSRVWVEGYGEAIAGDTGGAINGKRIDVFVKSKAQALQWGRRTVTVKILK